MRPGLPSLWHCSPLRLTGQQQPCNLCPALIKALAGNQVQRGVPGHCKGDMHYSHTGWLWLWLEGQASARQMEREVSGRRRLCTRLAEEERQLGTKQAAARSADRPKISMRASRRVTAPNQRMSPAPATYPGDWSCWAVYDLPRTLLGERFQNSPQS